MKLTSFMFHIVLIIACTSYTTGDDNAKTSNVDNFISKWKGVACTKKTNGTVISKYRFRSVTIHMAKPKRLSFRIPKLWKSGEYICVWKIKAHRDDMLKPKPKIKIRFRKLFIAYPRVNSYGMCEDKMYIRGSRNEVVLYRDNYLCEEEDGAHIDTKSDEATIVLEVRIPEDDKMGTKKSTSFIASVSTEINYREPDRFDVKEIIQSNNPHIKDYRFTWNDARQFCQEYGPKWDLCDYHSSVCEHPHKYPHTSINISTQYMPLLNHYNDWGEVMLKHSSCNPLTYRFGPPDWGLDHIKCPNTGCESKSYIYCCFHKKSIKLNKKLKPVDITIQSSVSAPGQYQYRFIDKEDYYDYHDYDDPSIIKWDQYWNTAGRITGDLKKVRLFSEHSPTAPNPLYFCSKHDEYSVEKFRFSISMSPCTKPWQIEFHKYTRTTPYENMRPIYFGQSHTGDGTRISFTPFCCGFDGVGSFMAYGLYKNNWKADINSKLCSNKTRFAATPGTISSPLFPKQYKQHTDCTWQIIAGEGKGILLQFGVVEFNYWDRHCTDTFLEFSSPTTIYGKICSTRQPVAFQTTGNVLNIKFSGENKNVGRFSFNYTETSKQAESLVKFTLPNENATWDAAANLCYENDMQLCRKEEICPFDTKPDVRKQEDFSVIPVSNKYNDWIRGNDYEPGRPLGGRFCTSILELTGPPTWGQSLLKDCTNFTLPYEKSICVEIKRETVYCCEKKESLWILESPVRVYIGYQWKYTNMIYRFDKNDEMYSTLYEVSEDYDYGDNPDYSFFKTALWKTPSHYYINDSNAIDYFVASETRVKGTFDKILFFCSKNTIVNLYIEPDVRQHKVGFTKCEVYWKLDFYLFVSNKKTPETPIALTIGKSVTSDNAFCCEEYSDSITFYVVEAGVIDQNT